MNSESCWDMSPDIMLRPLINLLRKKESENVMW